jgi:hypothetical protein
VNDNTSKLEKQASRSGRKRNQRTKKHFEIPKRLKTDTQADLAVAIREVKCQLCPDTRLGTREELQSAMAQ